MIASPAYKCALASISEGVEDNCFAEIISVLFVVTDYVFALARQLVMR